MTADDVENLTIEAQRIKKMPKLSKISKMCSCLCKKSKVLKMQERFFDQFEDKLDIENIASNQMNFTRFSHAYLSKEQRLLLCHQNNQAVSLKKV